jgi:3-methyladenine DNA glycosylase/8-oxoguanine DNA glycosylase
MPAELTTLLSSVRRMFDLSADPAGIATVLSGDMLLRPLLARRPGLRIPGAWDPFECRVRAIVGRQISVAVAVTMLGRLIARFGQPIEPRVSGMTRLFPRPEVLADANLDRLGLTAARREALRRLARSVCDKVIRFDQSSEEVGRILCSLPGVGRWTAGYVALRGLGEPDAYPFGDLALRHRAACGANGRFRSIPRRKVPAA